jgi:hypothetical protein
LALAVWAEDIDSWRGRKTEIKHPGYVALRFAIRDDPRYSDLAEYCEEAGLTEEYGILVLPPAIGYSLKLPVPGLFAHTGAPVTSAQICRFWGWRRTSAANIEKALRSAVKARFLTLVDPSSAELPSFAASHGRTRPDARTGQSRQTGQERTEGTDTPAPQTSPNVLTATASALEQTKHRNLETEHRFGDPLKNPPPDTEQGFWDIPDAEREQLDNLIVQLTRKPFHLHSSNWKRDVAGKLEGMSPDRALSAFRWAVEAKQDVKAALARAATDAGGAGFNAAKKQQEKREIPMDF